MAGAALDIGGVVVPQLRELAGRTDASLDVRGRGAMVGIEEPAPELAARIARSCHARGVVVLTCGTRGNVIRLLPPLVVGRALLDEGLDVPGEPSGERTR